jgi:hypothetical protein
MTRTQSIVMTFKKKKRYCDAPYIYFIESATIYQNLFAMIINIVIDQGAYFN